MRTLILMLSFITISINAEAQLLKKIKNKAEKAIEKEVENVIKPKLSNTDSKKENNKQIEKVESSDLQTNETKYDKVYKSPSKDDFMDLRVQTFNGLLRVGRTFSKNDNSLGSVNGMMASRGMRNRDRLKTYNYEGFMRLFDLKINSHLFDHLGPNLVSSGGTKVDKNYAAQNKLLWLKKTLSKNSGRARDHMGYNQGFEGENQFEKNRSYQSFVKNQLPQLKEWALSMFPKNYIEAYYVGRAHLSTMNYDFEKNGFWLNLYNDQQSNMKFSNSIDFELVENDYSLFSKQKRSKQVLFPINAENAEKLLNRINSGEQLFFVRMAKLYFEKEDSNNQYNVGIQNNEKYEFTNDIIDIYIGDELNEKIGTINISSAITRR